MKRELALEFARVTEAAALAAYKWVGRGKKEAADQAGVDSARTFAIGIIDDESRKLLEVTEKAREIGIQTAVAGNRLGDVGHAIQTFVEQNDFSVVRDFAGHGVGLALHEEPMIPNYGRKGRGLKIENGMVLAIEPMVNAGTYKIAMLPDGWTIITRDGKRSAHFEHSIAIIDGKPVILSELD